MIKGVKIYGVSLGPGDPELITLKGLKVLQNVDKIYYPGSKFLDGKNKSYSLSILQKLPINIDNSEGFYLEMNLDRKQAERVYEETALKIKEDVMLGKSVAIVSEGDLSTYSSFSYLLYHFQEFELPVQLIPGITSFATAASEVQNPMVLLNESMKIVPRVDTVENLKAALMSNDTIVLMKIKSVMNVVLEVLNQSNVSFVYAERLGTNQQFISTKLSELTERIVPYFSLIILKNERK